MLSYRNRGKRSKHSEYLVSVLEIPAGQFPYYERVT